MTIEQKYVFIGHLSQIVLEWAEHICVHDPKYYRGSVSTLYFDTTSLDHYYEKRNSDYLKTKLRLRWYDDVDILDRGVMVRCYLEAKRKHGVSRTKERKEMLFSSGSLRDGLFSDAGIQNAPSRACELDYVPAGILVPILLVQYERHRFVEPRSGSRVAVDTNIRCTQVNPAFIPRLPPVFLDAGVLEVKGPHRELPGSFHAIGAHLTAEAFSKYTMCCEHLMQPLGRRI